MHARAIASSLFTERKSAPLAWATFGDSSLISKRVDKPYVSRLVDEMQCVDFPTQTS